MNELALKYQVKIAVQAKPEPVNTPYHKSEKLELIFSKSSCPSGVVMDMLSNCNPDGNELFVGHPNSKWNEIREQVRIITGSSSSVRTSINKRLVRVKK
jgi:hypothetical protein